MKIIKTEGRHSHSREMKEKAEIGGVKLMPVLDVRDGERTRKKVEAILKEDRGSRGSKFMKPSYSGWGYSYNQRGGRQF